MFDAISILIVTGTFLILLWGSLLLARSLLSAILGSMRQAAGGAKRRSFQHPRISL